MHKKIGANMLCLMNFNRSKTRVEETLTIGSMLIPVEESGHRGHCKPSPSQIFFLRKTNMLLASGPRGTQKDQRERLDKGQSQTSIN